MARQASYLATCLERSHATASAQLAEQSVQAVVKQKGEPMELFLQHRGDLAARLLLNDHLPHTTIKTSSHATKRRYHAAIDDPDAPLSRSRARDAQRAGH